MPPAKDPPEVVQDLKLKSLFNEILEMHIQRRIRQLEPRLTELKAAQARELGPPMTEPEAAKAADSDSPSDTSLITNLEKAHTNLKKAEADFEAWYGAVIPALPGWFTASRWFTAPAEKKQRGRVEVALEDYLRYTFLGELNSKELDDHVKDDDALPEPERMKSLVELIQKHVKELCERYSTKEQLVERTEEYERAQEVEKKERKDKERALRRKRRKN
ncbi:hypothetical protein BJ508DRAFT_82404 [Ascobolus immersus RN42]|uniref:Uncharacterized protein n=1 Tax=Ascobolus immersus RN42 TaxID=1160509 RepID=A0A3N4HGL6_ASCIM|nr:hypothetical protein BJ508DRAFT_82404 [Ascobolus immersus RN42]